VGVLIRDDEQGMRAALREAATSAEHDEVPVGCVIVHDGLVIGRGHNQVEGLADATAHAEIVAIGAASSALGSWRLSECTLYVTLEPCAMCAGAIVLARLGRLVYGADDPKAGACGSVLDVIHEPRLNHRAQVTTGVLAEECGGLLREFFAKRRRAGKPLGSGAARARAASTPGRAAPRSTRHRSGPTPGGRS
jgi:tRNA(adenine34) deaminase